MAHVEKSIRQSVALTLPVVRRVRSIAKARRTSASRVIADLVAAGLEARAAEKARFLDLARRYKQSSDGAESERLREELARLTFGD